MVILSSPTDGMIRFATPEKRVENTGQTTPERIDVSVLHQLATPETREATVRHATKRYPCYLPKVAFA